MNFQVRLKSGLRGLEHSFCVLPIVGLDVDGIGQIAGSYHVLEMGLHFREYIETPNFPVFPPIPALPGSHFFSPLPAKVRGANVTGNLGEAIAAITARSVLGRYIGEIAHIRTFRPFHRRRVPDYLLNFSRGFPASVANVIHLPTTTPEWWPAEAKARHGEASASSGAEDAFSQLVSYWYELRQTDPDSIGFGLIFSCVYDLGVIRVHFLIPRDQGGLISAMRTGSGSFAGYPAHASLAAQEARGFIHDC